MIARIWRGRTKTAMAEEYKTYLMETGVKSCYTTEGNRGVYIWRKISGDTAEFVFVSLWDSIGVIRKFAGDNIDKAVYYPKDEEYLLELTPEVEHYEVLLRSDDKV